MEIRVYYHDTDAGGVVYYANYLKYLEESRTELLEKKGLSVQAFHERGLFYAVRKCSIAYRSPARYGDILLCEAHVNKITAAQLIFNQKIYRKNTKELIVEADVSLVCLTRDFKPLAIPDEIRTKLLT